MFCHSADVFSLPIHVFTSASMSTQSSGSRKVVQVTTRLCVLIESKDGVKPDTPLKMRVDLTFEAYSSPTDPAPTAIFKKHRKRAKQIRGRLREITSSIEEDTVTPQLFAFELKVALGTSPDRMESADGTTTYILRPLEFMNLTGVFGLLNSGLRPFLFFNDLPERQPDREDSRSKRCYLLRSQG